MDVEGHNKEIWKGRKRKAKIHHSAGSDVMLQNSIAQDFVNKVYNAHCFSAPIS